MIVDMHFHLADDHVQAPHYAVRPKGCVISRSPCQNHACLDFASMTGVACAVFAHPSTDTWPEILKLVAKKRALSYQHLEITGFADMREFDPLLNLSETVDMPVILHISHHGTQRLKSRDAEACLDHVVQRYPRLTIIISHLGGENCECAVRYAIAHGNIFLDTSCMTETTLRLGFSSPAETLRFVSETLSPTRLLYGSDLIWPESRHSKEELKILGHIFSKNDTKQILHKNASAILSTALKTQ